MSLGGIIRRFFYVKLCIQRVQSHYAFILAPANHLAILLILLKSFGIHPSVWWGVFCYLTLVTAMWIVGHLDIKYGFAKIEQAVANEQNPHLMELIRRSREDH